MKHDVGDWLPAWTLAVALIAAVALVGHSSAPRDGVSPGVDIARARGLALHLSDPRMVVERGEPLMESGDAAAKDGAVPLQDEPTAHPLC